MRQIEHEGELIWLRQSATFTVNGQTRTVEIALPVRPDAPAEEIEALMSQANVGMDALTHELDRRIAALLAGEKPQAAVTDAAHARSAPAASPAMPATPAEPAPVPATPPASTAPAAAAAAEAPTQTARPAAPAPARPQTPQTPPQQPQPAPARAGASGSLRPQPPAAAPAPAPAAPQKAAATMPAGPDISRAEFISAAAEMGLNPGQAMERLGVRSLQGLNLREALEALRRQLVRDGGGDASAMQPPATPPAQGSRPAQATRATSSASVSPAPAPGVGRREAAPPPRYFEEEDDLGAADFTFTMDGDADNDFYNEFDSVVGEEAAGYSAGGQNGTPDDFGALDDLDDLDLDDVPDFGPPPTAARTAPAAPVAPSAPAPAPSATERRGTARASAAAEPGEAGDVAEASPATEGRSLGMQRIGYFRSVRGGGAPTGQQRMAYRNIVVRELGDGDARALVQGIWRVTPDRLGSEQLDALVSWGKRDTFAEEAALVLAMLQEESERNENAASASTESAEAAAPQAAPRASGTRAAAQRPAPRTRTAATRTTPHAGDA